MSWCVDCKVLLMDFFLPLRIVWRATLQPDFEKRMARLRELRKIARFNRRDKSRDQEVVELFRRLTPSVAPPLRLVGGSSDGGYLIPDYELPGLALFSAGVGHVVEFEYDFAERGCDVFLADGTVSQPPRAHPNFFFEAKNIGLSKTEISLETWILGNAQPAQPIAIQMDIEGAEWVALSKESISDETLARIEWIVVEFHAIERLWRDKSWAGMVSVIDRMLEYFLPVAVHANNCASGLKIDNCTLPTVFEVTFLNKRAGNDATPDNRIFPTFRNCPNRPLIEWPIVGV